MTVKCTSIVLEFPVFESFDPCWLVLGLLNLPRVPWGVSMLWGHLNSPGLWSRLPCEREGGDIHDISIGPGLCLKLIRRISYTLRDGTHLSHFVNGEMKAQNGIKFVQGLLLN